MKKLSAELLTDLGIKSAKTKPKQYTLRDGNGLFVLIHPNGSKYFQLRTTLHGKQKLIQLGVYPILTLSEARSLAREKLRLVKTQQIDPVALAKKEKTANKNSASNTFKHIADDWLSIKKNSLAPSTHLKIKQSFNANVYSQFGKVPIKDIDNQTVRRCLFLMQERGALEFMEKTRGWIRQVFDFALADRLISENPIPVKDERLRKHQSTKFPHIKDRIDAGKLLRNLVDYGGSYEVSSCVYLQMHLSQRPSELREAKWVEFDFDNQVWTLPLGRSKSRKFMLKPHTVMLSRQVIHRLKEMRRYTGHSEFVFQSGIKDKPISEATVRQAFRQVFNDYHIVPHGCRHFFSTEANESGLFNKDVIEEFIGHSDKNSIREIYNEANYTKERKRLAQWWSDELNDMHQQAMT